MLFSATASTSYPLIALTEQEDDNEHSSTGLPFTSSAAEEMCNPRARTLCLDITYFFLLYLMLS